MNISVSDLEFENQNPNKNRFKIAGLDEPIDIQTIDNDVLKKIFHNRNFELDDIPKKSEIIDEENQSEYYKSIKKSLEEQIKEKRFAILSGPTGTGKTTLAKTFAYESSLPIYELGWDSEKTIDDFTKEIKTYRKNNILQIKEIPGILQKALVNGEIILLNEANSLSPDISLALANMTEWGFLVVGTKKIKIHPNFALIFTSNNGYAGTQKYNNAVIRKAGWLINFDYEPDIDWEFQVVKTLYQKIKSKFTQDIQISDENLEKITKKVREVREKITAYNNSESFENNLLSEDLNNFWDFFYIRFYEKLLNNLLSSWDWVIHLQKEFEKIIFSLVSENIHWLVGYDYISHNNDTKVLENILKETIKSDTIQINTASEKANLNPTVIDMLQGLLDENQEDVLENFWTNTRSEKINTWVKANFNPNLFRQVLNTEVQSKWTELKRIENFYNYIENVHSKLIDSRREKVIWEIKQEKLVGGEDVLSVEIDGRIIYFYSENPENLKDIQTQTDIKTKVFWNDKLKILLPETEEIWDISTISKADFIEYKNVFEKPKTLEIRRFSKIIQREIDDKKVVSFLGFSGEIRDTRYTDEKGNFYIPNSKVNDILLSNYEVISPENEVFQKATSGKHFLVINSENKVEFLTKEKIQEKQESCSILSQIKDKNFNQKLDNETKKKFANIDKLNLHNGWKEKSQTATPESIYGNKKPVSSRVYDILWPSFWEVISPSTKETLWEIETQVQLWNDILLSGPSGVWKSSYAVEIAKKMNLPYISFQIDSNIDEKTFSSNMSFNESEIENSFTPFLDFYINGGVVELKELNMSRELTFLNNYLDKNWSITIDWQTYKRNPNFHIIATINPFDNRLFPGTNAINLATQARFSNINIDYIKEVAEERDLLFTYLQLDNPALIQDLWEETIKNHIWEILNRLVFPIRNKLKELQKSQESGTDEELKILSKKIMTVDICKKILISSENREDLQEKIKQFFSLTQGEQELLSPDIQKIFNL